MAPFFFSAKMFDPESRMEPGVQRDGAYFLDRDPAYFSIVLNYLRSGVLLGAHAREGLEFYAILHVEQCSGSGIRCFFDPWIRDLVWLKNQDPIWTTLIKFPRALKKKKIFRLKFFDVDPGSGMEKIRIRDKHSGPQHCVERCSKHNAWHTAGFLHFLGYLLRSWIYSRAFPIRGLIEPIPVLLQQQIQIGLTLLTRGVPRGDAQDARASPLPPLCIPPGYVHPPPPQPERLVMRKDEAMGKRKKCKFVYLNIIIN
jgi:hypothetical protein